MLIGGGLRQQLAVRISPTPIWARRDTLLTGASPELVNTAWQVPRGGPRDVEGWPTQSDQYSIRGTYDGVLTQRNRCRPEPYHLGLVPTWGWALPYTFPSKTRAPSAGSGLQPQSICVRAT